MDHSFNIDIAKKVGIAGAVLLNNIYWWVDKNAKNQRNFFEGKYWTYNKKSAYLEQFPYLTENQLEYALTKLRDAGYIEVGNFNASKYDRTLWYTLTEKAYNELQNYTIHSGNFYNGETKNEAPIQDINKNINKNITLSTKEEQAPPEAEKKSYKDIFNNPSNAYIKEALRKFIEDCEKRNIRFRAITVENFASVLRDNAKDDPALAMAMVNQSIERGWKSIYPLKNYYKEKTDKKEAVSIPVSKEDKAKNPDGSYVTF